MDQFDQHIEPGDGGAPADSAQPDAPPGRSTDHYRRIARGRAERRRKEQRKRMRSAVGQFMLFILVLAGTVGFLWWHSPVENKLTGEMEKRGDTVARMIGNLTQPKKSLATSFAGRKQISVLLIGLDHVPVTKKDPGIIRRSDSVLLATTDFDTKQVRIASIPRDGWVQHWQNGKNFGYERMGHTYAYGQQLNLREHKELHRPHTNLDNLHAGGAARVEETVEHLLDMEVDFHVVIEFEGLVKLVDTLCPDGLEVDVEKNMKYSDKAGGLYIDLKKGPQKLSGDEVVQYARFRKDATGDIGRMERQRKVIKLLLAEMMKPANLKRLPAVANALNESVRTNMTADQLMALAQHMDKYSQDGVETMMLPNFYNLEAGREIDIPGLSIDEARSGGYHVQGIFKKGREETKAFLTDLSPPPPPEPEPVESEQADANSAGSSG